jgi:hypothetical protein
VGGLGDRHPVDLSATGINCADKWPFRRQFEDGERVSIRHELCDAGHPVTGILALEIGGVLFEFAFSKSVGSAALDEVNENLWLDVGHSVDGLVELEAAVDETCPGYLPASPGPDFLPPRRCDRCPRRFQFREGFAHSAWKKSISSKRNERRGTLYNKAVTPREIHSCGWSVIGIAPRIPRPMLPP